MKYVLLFYLLEESDDHILVEINVMMLFIVYTT